MKLEMAYIYTPGWRLNYGKKHNHNNFMITEYNYSLNLEPSCIHWTRLFNSGFPLTLNMIQLKNKYKYKCLNNID